jgi:polyisoprenoid-binding protein YceI
MAWKLDTAHALVEFSVKHMMIATIRGRFTKFDGTVMADADNPLNASVEGWVDVASIDTHDSNRDAHLRSPDFFDVEKFPRMTFRSKRIERHGEEYNVTGDMTIRDVTREVTFKVTDEGHAKDPWGNQRWGVSATANINRRDFGLNWNVTLETGGWLVGDQVKIATEMELVQVAETLAEPPAEAKA